MLRVCRVYLAYLVQSRVATGEVEYRAGPILHTERLLACFFFDVGAGITG